MAATVALTVAGRSYEIACDAGQEATLAELAVEIDRRAQQLLRSVGPVSDARLLVMVALTLMDDLTEARHSAGLPGDSASAVDGALAERLDRLTSRIESIADWVQKS
jgi:cell division protein ZapA